MNSFKKAIASLTTSAMFFGTVSSAFAAITIPEDVKGTEFEASVAKLTALEVIEGRDDGNYDAKATLNRAEAAKYIVGLLGLTDAAEAAKGTTIFTDVPADHWASGYISVASEKGIVKGVGNDQFNPTGNVTVAQFVTMLVRATGLGPVVEANGTWPSNYMTKASEIDLFDNGDDGKLAIGEATADLSRGLAAQLAWNTLTAEKWGETTYTSSGVEYGKLGTTLLADKYTDFQYKGEDLYFEDLTVIGTPFTGLDADRLTLYSEDYNGLLDIADYGVIGYEENEEEEEVAIEGAIGQEFEVDVEGLDYYNLLYKKVNVLAKRESSGKYTIVYLQETNEDTVSGMLEDCDVENDKITIDGKDYKLASDFDLKVNMQAIPVADIDDFMDDVEELVATDVKIKITASLDEKGKINFINAYLPGYIEGTEPTIVKEVSSKGIVKDVKDTKILDIEDLEDNDDIVYVVKDGKTATLDDIKEGDVIEVTKSGDATYVVLTSKTVEGELTAASIKNYKVQLTVDGEKYTSQFENESLMATSEGDIEDLESVEDIEDLTDLEGENVTLYFDSLGNVVAVVAEVETSGSQFAVVTNVDKIGQDTPKVQLLTSTNVKKTYTIDTSDYDFDDDDADVKVDVYDVDGETAEAVLDAADTIEVGDILQYKLNDDGEINVNSIKVVKSGVAYAAEKDLKGSVSVVDANVAGTTVNKNGETIKYDGKTMTLSDDAIIVNKSTDKTEVVKFASIIDDDEDKLLGDARIILNSDDEVVYMLTGIDALAEEDDMLYAIVTERTERNSKNYVTLATADGEKEYQLTAYDASNYNEDAETRDFVKYNFVNDKVELEEITVQSYDYKEVDSYKSVNTKVYNVKVIIDEEEEEYETVSVDKDVVVYVVDKKGNVTVGTVEDIEEGYYAAFGAENDTDEGTGRIEYMVVYEKLTVN